MLRPVSLAALLVLCAASVSAADDEPGQPLVEVPDYGLESISPAGDERPDGWASVTESGVVPRTAPDVNAILAVAKKAGIAEQKVAVRAIPLQRGSGEAREAGMLTLVAVNERPGAFTSALADAVVAGGWLVREMGSPMRVAVVWSSKPQAAATIRDWLVERVVRRTCERAYEKIVHAGRLQSQALYDAGKALLIRARRMEPEAGIYHGLWARIHERSEPAVALASYRKAVRKDAPIPPPARWKVLACARLGLRLLERGRGPEELAEALAVLTTAVELEEHNSAPFERFGARYNLACTYARMKQRDAAFEHLEVALAYGRKHLGAYYPRHYEHARSRDDDMGPLRGDERFAQLMAQYRPGPPPPAKDSEKKDEKKSG